jgi:hypothetical protein
MRSIKIVMLLLVALMLVGAAVPRSTVMNADGARPVPTPWLSADGARPPPTPWLVADGARPVPTPWLANA